MDFLELSKSRYSVRKFSDKKVEDQKLEKVLEAGRLAPTAKNSQSQKIFVLKSDEAIAKIRGATQMAFDAPVVLMVCYDTDQSYKNVNDTAYTYFPGGHYDGGEVDASIITTAMMFQATELGLGTLWARGFDATKIIEAFDLPKNLHLVCLLDIGYPAPDAEPSPRHSDRKPLSETVQYI